MSDLYDQERESVVEIESATIFPFPGTPAECGLCGHKLASRWSAESKDVRCLGCGAFNRAVP